MSEPNEVIRTKREVVEHVLLTALTEGSSVACLFSKQDLQDLIYAVNDVVENHDSLEFSREQRLRSLKDGMAQLLKEAFP
jgi:hypothetical protein